MYNLLGYNVIFVFMGFKREFTHFLFMFYIFIQPERRNFRHSKICNRKVNLQSQLKAIFTKIGN